MSFTYCYCLNYRLKLDHILFSEISVANSSMSAEAKSRLIGKHQAGNAEVALAAAALLRGQGFPQITQASMISGLGTAKLAGRFQVSSAACCKLDNNESSIVPKIKKRICKAKHVKQHIARTALYQ